MKKIVLIGGVLGLAVLSACSGESEDTGGEAGTAGVTGGSSGNSGSGGVAGTSSGGSGGVAGTSSGGSGGVAGTSSGGSGGVAGTSSGSGGTAGGGGSGGGSSCGCVDQELIWNQDGGFVAYRETNTLEPCHTFTLVREPFVTDPVTQMCTDPIESCDDIVDPGDIQAALAHPDVVAAFADSPILFGYDTRPVDGTVFQIHLGSRVIEIGRDCNGAADCIDEPPGVLTLRTYLQTLTEQIRSREPCSDVF